MPKETQDEDTYVPLKDKREHDSKKLIRYVFLLAILGTGLFFSVLLIIRTGGPFKFLFVALALLISYIIVDLIKKLKS